MISERIVPDTNLKIISGLVEPAVARDFHDEWVAQLGPSQHREITSRIGRFFEADYRIYELLIRKELAATHRILKILSLDTDDDAAIGLNFQPPTSYQDFHVDNPTVDDRVFVVHGSDGGAFDYAPNAQTERQAEKSYLSIEVGAGDVLLQTQQELVHRGRNASEHSRVTAALARVVHQPLDSYR